MSEGAKKCLNAHFCVMCHSVTESAGMPTIAVNDLTLTPFKKIFYALFFWSRLSPTLSISPFPVQLIMSMLEMLIVITRLFTIFTISPWHDQLSSHHPLYLHNEQSVPLMVLRKESVLEATAGNGGDFNIKIVLPELNKSD